MVSPYEKCPVFENDRYLLRVYSDERAWPVFNSDNCTGDFHCIRVEDVKRMIGYWLREYGEGGYVRWAVADKVSGLVIGTIELFNRRAKDYFDNCGLLRLDLRSDYEREHCIAEILTLIVPPAFELFDCTMMATKIPPIASERRRAAERMGFGKSPEELIGGHDGRSYGDYYVLTR